MDTITSNTQIDIFTGKYCALALVCLVKRTAMNDIFMFSIRQKNIVRARAAFPANNQILEQLYVEGNLYLVMYCITGWVT